MAKEAFSYIPPDSSQPSLRVIQPAEITPIRQGIEIIPNDIEDEMSVPFPHITSEAIHSLEPDDDLDHVAAHEFAHGYVAQKKFNMYVEMMTIVPKPGEYAGLTLLRGPFDLHAHQVVAAAGAAATDTRGAGSDFHMIRSMAIHEGVSPEMADALVYKRIAEASNALGDVKELMPIISKLIRLNGGTISGDEIPDLVTRARFEAKKGHVAKDRQFEEQTRKLKILSEESPDAPELIITVEKVDLGNGMIGMFTRINGEIQEESINITCMHCRMTNGHAIDCKYNEFQVGNPLSIADRSSLKAQLTKGKPSNVIEFRK